MYPPTRTRTRTHAHAHTYPNLSINSEMLAFKRSAKKTQQAESSKTPLLNIVKTKLHRLHILLVHNFYKDSGYPSNHLRSMEGHITG